MTENTTYVNPNSALVVETLAKMEAKLAEINKAIKEDSLDNFNTLMEEMKELEKQHAKARRDEVFCELKHTDNPIVEAITKHSFEYTKSKAERVDGVLKGYELGKATRQIDLVAFCTYCKLDASWQYDLELLNQLLTMKVAEELGMSQAEINRIAKSYFLSKKARERANGGTPTSSNQLVKMLQKVLDGVVFADNGKGKNAFKVNNHDIAYIFATYSKKDKKEVLKVSVSKHSDLNRLFADVAHRVLTGKKYGLSYRAYTDEELAVIKAEAKKKIEQSKVSETPAESAPTEEPTPTTFDETVVPTTEENTESAE